MFQHGLHLLASDTGKPSQELVHRGAVFEVRKKGRALAPEWI